MIVGMDGLLMKKMITSRRNVESPKRRQTSETFPTKEWWWVEVIEAVAV
jgi:hypothetical protein